MPEVETDSLHVDDLEVITGSSLLVRGESPNPHLILGRHKNIVRAFVPGASSVTLVAHLTAGVVRTPMRLIDQLGLYQAPISQECEQYFFEARFESITVSLEDPYRFDPTIQPDDLQKISTGSHEALWKSLGARAMVHQGVAGVSFCLWAPHPKFVRVIGDWNNWNGLIHQMRRLDADIWELFIPGVEPGARYKYEIGTQDGTLLYKADPMARQAEGPPGNASVVASASNYEWGDASWVQNRSLGIDQAVSIYEVHLGSWRKTEHGFLSYIELSQTLPNYVKAMGFSHVELMPVSEYPYDPSWGYQITGYYAPTSRYGSPDELRQLIDAFHRVGIGVILDWVPAHFPRDEFALCNFDGQELYEHPDPNKGLHPEWTTAVFNYEDPRVRNFLVSNVSYWVEEFHVDGIRVDAVESLLFLDYARRDGEWKPNKFGGREDLEAIEMMRQMNQAVEGASIMTIAEDSSACEWVSLPIDQGGVGFTYKWNLGWMHDTTEYLALDPLLRPGKEELLKLASDNWRQSYLLPLSHDEVKFWPLIDRFFGDESQRFATLRSLYAWMWAHPGKKTIFMGNEFAQKTGWSFDRELNWDLLRQAPHLGMQTLVRELNILYSSVEPLSHGDFPLEGFKWGINDPQACVSSFMRSDTEGHELLCIGNFSTTHHFSYRVGVDTSGEWCEILNTEWNRFGGGEFDLAPMVLEVQNIPWDGHDSSIEVELAPLSVKWLMAS